MKTQTEMQSKLSELRKSWISGNRNVINPQIKIMEWALDIEAGVINLSISKYTMVCPTCKKKFNAITKRRKFCSNSCRVRSYKK